MTVVLSKYPNSCVNDTFVAGDHAFDDTSPAPHNVTSGLDRDCGGPESPGHAVKGRILTAWRRKVPREIFDGVRWRPHFPSVCVRIPETTCVTARAIMRAGLFLGLLQSGADKAMRGLAIHE